MTLAARNPWRGRGVMAFNSHRIRRGQPAGNPVILTVNGRARLVALDVAAYQKMLDALDHAAAIEGIERGLTSAARAGGRPAREVLDAIRPKHALSR